MCLLSILCSLMAINSNPIESEERESLGMLQNLVKYISQQWQFAEQYNLEFKLDSFLHALYFSFTCRYLCINLSINVTFVLLNPANIYLLNLNEII